MTTNPLASDLASPRNGDIASGEWDALFCAVIARLRHVLVSPAEIGSLHGSAPDCLLALEQLHERLTQERGRAARVAAELMQVYAALSTARAGLATSQAGERRARHLASHDGLTALPNRQLFDRRLAQALNPGDRQPPALAVFFLDLDGFKPINDRHGHGTGDALLRVVASRLAGAVRASDMVCRLGGDEFACLVADPMDREQLSHLACKLFEAISAPLTVGALELSVRPSIGIARCPTDGNTPAALLKHADAAMFRAKRRQLGHAFFDARSDA